MRYCRISGASISNSVQRHQTVVPKQARNNMNTHDFMDLLTVAVHVREALRPDIVTLPVVGYPEYLTYPNFQASKRNQPKDPPPRLLDPETDLLTIDEYLGTYNALTQRVSLFDENIDKAAEMLPCRADDLRDVVRFHEYAHAAIHLGVTKKERIQSLTNGRFRASRLRQLTTLFRAMEPFLHEQLAQLVTYHVLMNLCQAAEDDMVRRTAHRLLDVFAKLMQRQPSAYRVERYLSVPLEQLRTTIHLIKEGALVGRFEPWKEIMTLA